MIKYTNNLNDFRVKVSLCILFHLKKIRFPPNLFVSLISVLFFLGLAIRRIFGSDADSDSLKNPLNKNPDFPRISDSWNFSGLRIFGFGFRIFGFGLLILAIFLYVYS